MQKPCPGQGHARRSNVVLGETIIFVSKNNLLAAISEHKSKLYNNIIIVIGLSVHSSVYKNCQQVKIRIKTAHMRFMV